MLVTEDAGLRDMLHTVRTIAVVGHSDNPARTSYQIAQYLRQVGYTVFAVNPTVDQINGYPVYASLADVPGPIDLVNVFRRAEHLPGVVDEAIAVGAKAVWGQLGVSHVVAAAKAETAQLPLVMNRCIKVEHRRLNV